MQVFVAPVLYVPYSMHLSDVQIFKTRNPLACMNLILLYSNQLHILATRGAIFLQKILKPNVPFLTFTAHKCCSANDVILFYSHLHNVTNCAINNDSRFYLLLLFFHHHQHEHHYSLTTCAITNFSRTLLYGITYVNSNMVPLL